ncbi:MAG: antibiotic biosynthesis monooxygenase [Campylobacterales bacterium]|nr:antibiotic biosynthesis monooxygenase [Campylobacterales bacterium]
MHTVSYIQDTVHLVIRITTKKEEREKVLLCLYETIAPTHKEEGCLEYRIIQNGISLLVIGKWKSQMALDIHLLLHFHLHLFENILPGLCKKIRVQTYKEIEPPITSLSIL